MSSRNTDSRWDCSRSWGRDGGLNEAAEIELDALLRLLQPSRMPRLRIRRRFPAASWIKLGMASIGPFKKVVQIVPFFLDGFGTHRGQLARVVSRSDDLLQGVIGVCP